MPAARAPKRDGQAREAQDGVHHDVRVAREFFEAFVAHKDLHVTAKKVRERGAMRLRLHADALDIELPRDGRQFAHLLAARDRHQFEALAFAAQHIEGLDADGSRGSQQRHAVAHVGHR